MKPSLTPSDHDLGHCLTSSQNFEDMIFLECVFDYAAAKQINTAPHLFSISSKDGERQNDVWFKEVVGMSDCSSSDSKVLHANEILAN